MKYRDYLKKTSPAHPVGIVAENRSRERAPTSCQTKLWTSDPGNDQVRKRNDKKILKKRKMAGKWLVTKNPLKTFGLRDIGEAFKSKDLVSGLVRESIQNALDAKAHESDLVTVKFGYRDINPNEIPGASKLREVFELCRDFPERSTSEKEFFENGLKILGNAHGSLGMFSISDYGTCGLTGARTNANGSRFKGLVMTSGAGNDDGRRGGGFGLGKDVMYLASELRTIFFSTIENDDGYAAHMGVGCLATFNYAPLGGNPQADRNIFFCSDNYDPENTDAGPAIPGIIKFSNRKPGEYGTDMYIPGFKIKKNVDQLSAEILGEVLKSFVVAVADGALEVVLPTECKVSKDNLGQMVDWYKTFGKPSKDKELISELYELTQKPWIHSESINLPLDKNFPAKSFDYKFIRSDSNINKCFVTREKGMVVHTIKNVCGTSSAIGFIVVRDAELNSAFKKMENASHNRFEAVDGRIPNKDERKVAKMQLSALEDNARLWAEAEAGVKIDETTDAVLPDELNELMDACSGRFTIGEIKVNTRKKIELSGVRVKKHKHKNTKVAQAIPANITDNENDDAENEPGVQINDGVNLRARGNPVNSKKPSASDEPEANGFVLRENGLTPLVFYAVGKPETGKYRVSFKVPRTMEKVCACFSSTAENDGREVLLVKSAKATSNGLPIATAPDLKNTAVAFENVSAGQIIDAEIEFDVAHYCYMEIRYYEKKNV